MSRAYLKRHLNWHDEAGEAASPNSAGRVVRRADPQSLLSAEPWPSLAMDAAESSHSPVREDMPARAGRLSLLRDTLLLVLFLALVLVGFSVFDRHGTVDSDLAAKPPTRTVSAPEPAAR
jgi:hypothetical protein